VSKAPADAPFIWRRYRFDNVPAREVVLAIGPPRPDFGGWACRIVLCDGEGQLLSDPTDSFGSDPLQAMQLALFDARHALEELKIPLQWEDGTPGDVGIPMTVPTDFGFKVQRRLERLLQTEAKRLSAEIGRRLRQRKELAPVPKKRAPRGVDEASQAFEEAAIRRAQLPKRQPPK
jgi:hypothetical protein